jgi:hypothetical protein
MFFTVKRLAGYSKTYGNFRQVLVRGAGTISFYVFHSKKAGRILQNIRTGHLPYK